jgi:hypothetical protein
MIGMNECPALGRQSATRRRTVRLWTLIPIGVLACSGVEKAAVDDVMEADRAFANEAATLGLDRVGRGVCAERRDVRERPFGGRA